MARQVKESKAEEDHENEVETEELVADPRDRIRVTKEGKWGVHRMSNFIDDPYETSLCGLSLDSGFCWNDQNLANGLVHFINTTDFYYKYIYEPALWKPRLEDVPPKS